MYAQNHENVRKIFCEDVRERRSIGRGGYHQKNGSKSRKCSLPSDHLTEGAWKKMNGPITGVTMGAPMEWTTFKDASDRLKFKYIEMLSEKFNATKAGLCSVFGVSMPTLNKELEKAGANALFRTGKKMSKAQREALLSFFGCGETAVESESDDSAICNDCDCESETTDFESEVCDSECVAESETNAVEPKSEASDFSMSEFNVTFTGAFDADHVANSLRYMVAAGTTVKVKISCELLG